MKAIIISAFIVIVFSGSIHAAEYFHTDARRDTQFRNSIGNFLNLHRPEVTDIHCMLSGGKDFHLWVKPGNSSNRYDMELLNTRGNTGWTTEVSRLIESGRVALCAFNADAEIWLIEAQ